MLDFLKKVSISVALDRPAYYPGDPLSATVRISSPKDVAVELGTIALVAQDRYRRMIDSSKGTWKMEVAEQAGESKTILHDTVIPAGANLTYDFAATIPAAAPPTCQGGKICSLRWFVRVKLARKMAADSKVEADVQVLKAAPGKHLDEADYGSSSDQGKATMALRLPGLEVVLGEPITGELRIHANEALNASEIRIEAVCHEQVLAGERYQWTHSVPVTLAGKTKLAAGQQAVYPFELTLRAGMPVVTSISNMPLFGKNVGSGDKFKEGVPITFHATNWRVLWTLRGVLARQLQKDVVVEEPILVCSAHATERP